MRNLVIFGDTPFAERLYAYIKQEGVDKVVAFTQERDFISKENIQSILVTPFEDLKDELAGIKFSILLGIGYTKMNDLREKIYNMCVAQGYQVASYISSRAICYSDQFESGTIILPNVMIGPGCKIGRGNFFGASCAISHDSEIGNFNFFSTNVIMGGHANIDSHCFIGLHSTIKNDIKVDDYSMIGASSNLLKSTNCRGGVFVGNPAKRLVGKNSKDVII